MAFVFLNRCIDLADAIEDGTGEIMDSPYLYDTDIPLENTNLPETKYLSVSFLKILITFELKLELFINFKNEKHEEIKTYVITVSMNRKIEQSLNRDERGCYEATLVGPDNHVYSPCVVTGKLIKRVHFN